MASEGRGGGHRGLSRRQVLLGGGGFLAALGYAGVRGAARPDRADRITEAPAFLDRDPFTLGVASGDPLPDGVVLWTRLAPDAMAGGGMPPLAVSVDWQVATDERFRRVVRRGVAIARPQRGHSVHVEVGGLDPARWYWYRFRVGGWISPHGRTRTAPALDASPSSFAFAFASCQDWQNGYFTAYRDMADQDLDLVVHLGDYIYEFGPDAKTRPGAPPGRVHDGPEPTDLTGYRNRYALYRTDPDLQAAHARFPWVVTWDDHEVEDNYAAGVAQETTSPAADFATRRVAAYLAYYEHMPLRPSWFLLGVEARLYRRLRFGDLVELNVLDTRQYRDDQPCGDGMTDCDDRQSPDRTITGADQERWLVDGLAASRATWTVVAQQAVFAQTGLDHRFNVDQWDGYPVQRRRLTGFLGGPAGPVNTVIVTGDLHSSWVNDIQDDYDDPASPTVATEFVGTSITSAFSTAIAPATAALAAQPHVKDFDGDHRGYAVARVERGRWTTEFRVVETIDSPTSAARARASWVVEDGIPGAHPA